MHYVLCHRAEHPREHIVEMDAYICCDAAALVDVAFP